jgi:hypothetical protein
MKLYHGSPIKGITEFHLNTEERYASVEGRGLYLTDSYSIARSYAGSEGSVYELKIKNLAIFDATSSEEFNFCLETLSKKINFNLLNLEYVKETIDGLISGQYRITDSGDGGFAWQIKNLLDSDDFFMNERSNDSDEVYKTIYSYLNEYLKEHSILKYNDLKLGEIYLCFEPERLIIDKEIEISSKDDEKRI